LPEGNTVSDEHNLEETMMRLQPNERQPIHEPTPKDETLVPDTRARLTPAQMVEHKLLSLMKTAPLLVSRLQTVRQRGPR
jgi:hypothetical protein